MAQFANHPWCVAPAFPSLASRSTPHAMRFNASRERAVSPGGEAARFLKAMLDDLRLAR